MEIPESMLGQTKSMEQLRTEYELVHQQAKTLADSVLLLCGRSTEGPLAYMRQNALTRLEESMHWIGSAMQMLMQRTPEAQEAVAEETLKGMAKGNTPSGGLRVEQGGK